MPHHTRSSKGYKKQKERQLNFERYKNQRALSVRYVWQTSFNDHEIHEIVCTKQPEQIDAYLTQQLLLTGEPQAYYPMNSDFCDGLVLANQLQYEFIANTPSNSSVSDLEQLTPISRYKMTPVTVKEPEANKLLLLIQTP